MLLIYLEGLLVLDVCAFVLLRVSIRLAHQYALFRIRVIVGHFVLKGRALQIICSFRLSQDIYQVIDGGSMLRLGTVFYL